MSTHRSLSLRAPSRGSAFDSAFGATAAAALAAASASSCSARHAAALNIRQLLAVVIQPAFPAYKCSQAPPRW